MTRGEGVQHRQVDLLALAPEPVNGGQGIEITVIGQVEGDASGPLDLGVFLEARDQLLGRRLLLGLTQALSALADELAQALPFGLGIGHGGSCGGTKGLGYLNKGP